jgi:ankyrin repeat protein
MACQADMDVLDDFSEVLLNFGAELNAVDVEGHSALHFCSLYGKTETAKTLVRILPLILKL